MNYQMRTVVAGILGCCVLLGFVPAYAQSLQVSYSHTNPVAVSDGALLFVGIDEFTTSLAPQGELSANKHVTWELLTGSANNSADAARFELTSSSASATTLALKGVLDYETVTSTNGDHTFMVAIKATAGVNPNVETVTINYQVRVFDKAIPVLRDRNNTVIWHGTAQSSFISFRSEFDESFGRVVRIGYAEYASVAITVPENITGPLLSVYDSDYVANRSEYVSYILKSWRDQSDVQAFNLDLISGVLTSEVPLDFENPTDQDRDNVYWFTVYAQVEYGSTRFFRHGIRVKLTVTNDSSDDPPAIVGGDTAHYSVAEHTRRVATLATDRNASWAIEHGAPDSDKFTIDADGTLWFVEAPDYENPTDLGDSPGNNTYVVDVYAYSENSFGDDIQRIIVTVLDVAEGGVGSVTSESVVPKVRLSATPNPVDEGNPVNLTVHLSESIDRDITIPLRFTPDTAEASDYTTLDSITISVGSLSNTGTINTVRDTDTDDESFIVTLGTFAGGVARGSPTSERITVVDHTPLNGSPNAVSDEAETLEDTSRMVDVLKNDSDPDGDTLQIKSVSIPSFGEAEIVEGMVRYTPDPDYHGMDSFTYEIYDGQGGFTSGEVAITVLPVNDTPRGINDQTETNEDESVSLNPLVNDMDVDGDSLRVQSVSMPSNGSTKLVDGNIVYTPAANFHGSDSFSYVVVDGEGATAKAVVEIVVLPVNDGPIAANDKATTEEDEPVTVDVLVNDTDVDDERLRIVSVSDPEHGATRNFMGSLLYEPAADFHGVDRFSYVVSDGQGVTATAEVVVVVNAVNDGPIALNDEATTREDEVITIDVLANDADIDGDRLVILLVSQPARGSVQIVENSITYVPDVDDFGTVRFTYVVSDGHGLSSTASVVVTIDAVNDAPEPIGAIVTQTLDEGGGEITIDLTQFFRDVDDSSLTYSASTSAGSIVGVTTVGSELTLLPEVYGSATVTVTAVDPGGLTAIQQFTVNVSDEPVRRVASGVLASMARAHLSSVRMALGRRISLIGDRRGSHLESQGHTLSFSAPLSASVHRDAHSTQVESIHANPFDGYVPGLDLLRTTSFHVTLNAEEQGGSPNDPILTGRSWQIWGLGDIQSFNAEPSAISRYEGELQTVYLGADTVLSDRWMAGVAVSSSRSDSDWQTGRADGQISTRLTAIYPYLQWADGLYSIWGTAGEGRGTIENVRTAGLVGESDLKLQLALIEIRRELEHEGDATFALRSDAAWAMLRTSDGPETIDRHKVSVNQFRFGTEFLRSITWANGLTLLPFGEVHVRRDGGAEETGMGMEVIGGSRLSAGRIWVDAQGRYLTLPSAANYRERGLGLTAGLSSKDSESLSVSFSFNWGDSATGAEALWQEQVFNRYFPREMPEKLELVARSEFGMRLRNGPLLTWFGALSQAYDDQQIVVGVRVGGVPPSVFYGSPTSAW